jgi:type IV pilus assembly protein PilA
MLQALRRRFEQDEEGFTLIELMVVVLIIAILLAIAIPTFLGARTKAQDRAAQSNLRNALTAEKTLYVDSQVYISTTASITAVEPSLTYNNLATPIAGAISVQVVTAPVGNVVMLAIKSASGTCFELEDVATGTGAVGVGAGTTYGKDTACGVTPATVINPSF